MAVLLTMNEQEQITEHLKQCGYWYARLRKIINHQITFPTWDEEEKAGNEAIDKWNVALDWLEVRGIRDEDIVYNEAKESATIAPRSNIPPT
jgi:sulfur transfer protein SufE